MIDYLYSRTLSKGDFSEETRKLDYLRNYLDDSKLVDQNVKEKFPIESFGFIDDDLRILGTKTLLDVFDKLASEKYDFVDCYGHVTFLGVNERKQLELNFDSQDFEENSFHSVYDFYNDFLDQFNMTKFTNYCFERGYHDIIHDNIETLLARNAETEKQFRLLRDTDGSWGIRALTSDVYKNYDNGVVLYLSLLAIHRYAAATNTLFQINSAYISDSYMHVFFERPDPITIPEVGKVYLGIAISNGEIRNYKFKAELRYRIVDFKSGKTIAAIYDNPIFSIVHSMTVSTIEEQINKLYRLDEYEKGVVAFVTNLYKLEKLSEDSTYFLLNDLIRIISACSDISKKTKDEFKKLETQHLINNALSLIEFFDKVQTISTDMDEKVFVERIFHKVMYDLFQKLQS